ncbi:TolC family protein [Danxiaibacter flavus]|uniref:TolC family protein n=1 Tax=Danxiaibacter flavus TaxID=3049108 RepID=A0ABV3ZEZ7_9BACT|nr:TolC family protein [Chitinophagaceae bacterium DXS]
MKRNIVRTILAVLLLTLFNSGPVMAQETRVITLQEAIDLSIKNSKQLKNNKAKIDEATAALKEAIERKLPDFKITGGYMYLTDPNINLKTKSDNSGSGGSSGGAMPSVNQAAYGIANVSLPIYSGLRIQYGIESAKYLEQATELDADFNKEQITFNAIGAFANLYKSKVSVDVIKENLSQSKQRDADFANLEKNGLLARNDMLKAALQTSNIELTLVNAENNLALANVSLNLMMGLPEKTQLVVDSSSLQVANSIQTIEDYEQQAFQSRKDVQALSLRKKAAETNVKSVKGEYYPSLALTGGYIAADIPGLVTITNAFNIGVGVQYSPSSLWKTKSKVEQAKARERQVMANQEELTDQIRLQINQAYQDYIGSKKKIEVATNAVVQATENYRITKNKYDNSLVTTTDLLDANVALLQTKINAEVAKTDAIVAYNMLLQRAGILTSQQAK